VAAQDEAAVVGAEEAVVGVYLIESALWGK
jgi:hypothetical protein